MGLGFPILIQFFNTIEEIVFYFVELSPSQPSTHWKGERYVSVALLSLIPAGIIYPSAPVDWALAVVIPLHNHW